MELEEHLKTEIIKVASYIMYTHVVWRLRGSLSLRGAMVLLPLLALLKEYCCFILYHIYVCT